MDFKVDYARLYDIGDVIFANKEQLFTHLNDLVKIIDDIKNSWDGPDYENFKTTSETYIKDLQPMIDRLDYIGKYMMKSSNVYADNDNEWGTQMKRFREEKLGYEQQHND